MIIFYLEEGVAFEYSTCDVSLTEIYDEKSILKNYLLDLYLFKEVYLSPCGCYAIIGDLEGLDVFFKVEDGRVARYEFEFAVMNASSEKLYYWIKSKGSDILRITKPTFDIKNQRVTVAIQTSAENFDKYFFKLSDY